MAAFLLHVGASVLCAHGAPATIVPSNARVRVGGQPVAVVSDVTTVAACPFTLPAPKPSPCVKVQWLVPAARVLVNHQPALLQNSSGLCQSPEQAPQGPPNVAMTQIRVRGV